MVGEKVLQEIVPDDLAGGRSLVPQGLGDKVQILLQRVRAVDHPQPLAQTGDDVVLQIRLVGEGEDVVGVGLEAGILPGVPLTSGVDQAFHIQGVPPEHAAHGIGKQGADFTAQVGPADGYVPVLHLRRQLVLEAVNVDENAIEFFFVGFELIEASRAFCVPLFVFIRN